MKIYKHIQVYLYMNQCEKKRYKQYVTYKFNKLVNLTYDNITNHDKICLVAERCGDEATKLESA